MRNPNQFFTLRQREINGNEVVISKNSYDDDIKAALDKNDFVLALSLMKLSAESGSGGAAGVLAYLYRPNEGGPYELSSSKKYRPDQIQKDIYTKMKFILSHNYISNWKVSSEEEIKKYFDENSHIIQCFKINDEKWIVYGKKNFFDEGSEYRSFQKVTIDGAIRNHKTLQELFNLPPEVKRDQETYLHYLQLGADFGDINCIMSLCLKYLQEKQELNVDIIFIADYLGNAIIKWCDETSSPRHADKFNESEVLELADNFVTFIAAIINNMTDERRNIFPQQMGYKVHVKEALKFSCQILKTMNAALTKNWLIDDSLLQIIKKEVSENIKEFKKTIRVKKFTLMAMLEETNINKEPYPFIITDYPKSMKIQLKPTEALNLMVCQKILDELCDTICTVYDVTGSICEDTLILEASAVSIVNIKDALVKMKFIFDGQERETIDSSFKPF